MNKKLIKEDLQKIIESENYIFYNLYYKKDFKNRKIAFIKYKCHKCDNIINQRWNCFKKGKRCSFCSGNKKHNLVDVIKFYLENDLKFLDNIYKNVDTPHLCKCLKCENIIKKSYKQIKEKGHVCEFCNKGIKYTIDIVKKIYEEHGFLYIDNDYINNTRKNKCICLNEHVCEINLMSLKQRIKNKGCKKCFYERNKGKNNPRWNPNKKEMLIKRKIYNIFRSNLVRHLKIKNITKKFKTKEYFDYTVDDFINYINDNKKYKKKFYELLDSGNLHIDHILPIYSFIKYNVYDIKIINHLSNLQPMDSKNNIKKSNKFRKKDFHNFMKKFKNYIYDIKNDKYIKILNENDSGDD